MAPHDVFTAVKSEFDEATAVCVVAIYALHLSQKIKPADLATSGRFAARLRKKARKLLWQTSDADFELAYAIDMQLHAYDCCQTLGTPDGAIGGCVKKTLRELLASAEEQPAGRA